MTSHPEFNTADIDVVGCGSTIGNVLRFANSTDRSFRLYAEMVGNTVFLVRTEISPTEVIEDVRGYGHSFPEAYTTWEPAVKGSATHQRLITYDFGGLKILLRYEGDGYLRDKVGDDSSPAQTAGFPTDNDHNLEEDDIIFQGLGRLKTSGNFPSNAGNLSVKLAGCEVPQKAMFDLKTRSSRREFDMEEIYPRLWLNRTPNFILAYHQFGNFHDIQVRDVAQELKGWEMRNSRSLYALRATLKEIIRAVKLSASHKVCLQ